VGGIIPLYPGGFVGIGKGYVKGRGGYYNASGMAFHMTIALLEAGISEVDILSIMMDDRFGVSKVWKPQGIEYIEVKINEAVETLKTFAANPPKDQSSTYLLYPFVAFNEIKPSTTPAYLVKGIIPSEGQTTVWGKPKCGKSFWVFDLVMHIALGWSYRGRRVKQCAVAYMALEGGHGFKRASRRGAKHIWRVTPDPCLSICATSQCQRVLPQVLRNSSAISKRQWEMPRLVLSCLTP
jgi:hypothetical protein